MSKYLVAYSAVLDGQGNPFGSADDHERGVESILQTLMGSKTGKAVFKKIIAHGVVRIKPYDASLRLGLPGEFLFKGKEERARLMADWRAKRSPAQPAATTVVQPAE